MENKKSQTMYIGGGYNTQPEHKSKILPLDFLAAFYNVEPDDSDEILEFANNYNFGGYLMPDQDNSIMDKFQHLHNRYHDVLMNLIHKNKRVNHVDLELINSDLKDTSPAISLRHTVNDLNSLDESFCLYLLSSVKDEEPIYSVDRRGSLENDHEIKEKESFINIKMSVPEGSQSKWYIRRMPEGIKQAPKLIPSEKWDIAKGDLRYATLHDWAVEKDKDNNPVSLEMNLKIGKVDFAKEELTAVWSPTTGASFIAKRIWDYINSDYVGYKYNICNNCGKMHLGTSKNFCDNPKCKTEWDAKRKKLEYDLKKK